MYTGVKVVFRYSCQISLKTDLSRRILDNFKYRISWKLL